MAAVDINSALPLKTFFVEFTKTERGHPPLPPPHHHISSTLYIHGKTMSFTEVTLKVTKGALTFRVQEGPDLHNWRSALGQ